MVSLTSSSTKCSARQAEAEKFSVVLAEQSKNIAERKSVAEKDLAGAEPALLAAQEAVKGVTKDNIVELKNYAKPPAKVALALEPAVALIKNTAKKPEWKEI